MDQSPQSPGHHERLFFGGSRARNQSPVWSHSRSKPRHASHIYWLLQRAAFRAVFFSLLALITACVFNRNHSAAQKNMMKSVSLKLSDISAPSGPQNDRRGPESERSSAMIPDIFRILDQQHLHRPIRSKKASVWQRNKRCLDPTSAQPQFPRDSLLRILKGEASELTGFYLPTGNLTAPPSLQPAADKLKESPEKG